MRADTLKPVPSAPLPASEIALAQCVGDPHAVLDDIVPQAAGVPEVLSGPLDSGWWFTRRCKRCHTVQVHAKTVKPRCWCGAKLTCDTRR